MNPSRFALFAGLLWAFVSLSIIVISIINGMEKAYVELDFRLFTETLLLSAWLLNFKEIFLSFTRYARGYDINILNICIAVFAGFVDGFFSGYLIAKINNVLFILSSKKVLNFIFSCGIVFGLCSYLLSVVNLAYSLGYESFDLSIRPLSLLTYILSYSSDSNLLSNLIESYRNFPAEFGKTYQWLIWGFIDGTLGGYLFSVLVGRKLGIK